MGMSLTTGQPVLADLAARLPASAELTLAGLVLAIGVAVPLGIAAAVRQGSWVDHLCRLVVTAGVSLPVFFTGLLLVYVFYFLLGWAPAPVGRLDAYATPPPTVTGLFLVDAVLARDWEGFRGALAQLVLPACTLGLFALAPIARITRASMLAVLGADFVRTARSIGPVQAAHGRSDATRLRNAILPVDHDCSESCFRASCSAPTCWWRKCSLGPASASYARGCVALVRLSRRCRASC